MKRLNLFISAGEASGDMHGAEVIHFLRDYLQEGAVLEAWGMGGPKLKECQIDLIQDSSQMGIIGIADVLKNLGFLYKLEQNLINEIKKRKPDIALLIDYPGLNLRLAKAIKKFVPSCKIVFYIAPQVWAWNKSRLKKLPNLVDRLLTILPFEEALHKEAGTSTRFVGNPSAWSMQNLHPATREEILSACNINPEYPVIGIFPGSRKREIDFMLPVLLQAAKQLKNKKPNLQFVLVRANTIQKEQIQKHISKIDFQPIIETGEKNHYLLKAVDIAWLTSGTVTLEAACTETPLILGYKEFPLFFKGYLFLRQINKIGLPNIIAQEFICPELLQEDCIAEKWVSITEEWLNSPSKIANIKQNLRQKVKEALHTDINPAANVAYEILMIHQINKVSRENQIHMKEQAHQNSQQTKKEISQKGIIYN